MKNLTLSVDPEVIRQARALAKETGTGVSSMFERFVRFLSKQRGAHRRIGPLTRKASGIITLPKGAADRQLVEDTLLGKDGMKR